MSDERGMTAFLEFPLPECEEQHRDALNGSLWKAAMQAYDERIRRKMKDLECATPTDKEHEKELEDVKDGLYIAREYLHDECYSRGLDIWE